MTQSVKIWLVRTKNKEILGPFSEQSLLEALQARKFSLDDEISKSSGNWVSAQGLAYREKEELTGTHTRSVFGMADLTQTPSVAVSVVKPEALPEKTMKSRPPLWIGAVSASLLGVFMVWILGRKPETAPPRVVSEVKSTITEQTEKLVFDGQTQKAIEALARYHMSPAGPTPKDPAYKVLYASLLITQSSSLDLAKKLLDETIQDPLSTPALKSQAHHWLGFALLSRSEGDMGESHFLEALQLNPREAASRFNLGRTYLKQRHPQQALDYFQLAELEVPNLWLIHIYKGRAKNLLGREEEAEASFRRAIEVAPDRWMSYLFFAAFLNAHDRNAQAVHTLSEMLTKDPQFESQSLPPLGFFEEKIAWSEYLETFREIVGAKVQPLRELGTLYLQTLEQGAQGAASKKLLAHANSNSLLAKFLSLRTWVERGDNGQAISSLISQMPEDLSELGSYAYLVRAQGWMFLAKMDKARQDLDAALKISPREPRARLLRAKLFSVSGAKADALKELERLLQDQPTYIPARNEYRLLEGS